jgi:DNA-binding transcriptional LysR family regulator
MFTSGLRAFDEAVRAGSIRRASDAMGVAPSSVSRHIAILEREMGTKLFERRAGGVELTYEGRLVAAYARSVLGEYDALRTDLDDVRGTQRRLVRLALVESVAHYGPVSAAHKFLAQYPAVSFNVRVAPAPGVVDAVREAHADIGVTFCAEPDPDITTLASLPEPIVLAVNASHPLADRREIALEDMAKLALALPDQDFGIRRILDRAAAAAGLRFMPVLASNVFETLRDFARAGSGAAILPLRATLAKVGEETLRAIPLAGPVFRDATIDVIVHRRRRSPRVVIAFAEQLVSELEAPQLT